MLGLPLGCYDLILGVKWLTSLGPIIWDFSKLQMEFSIEGKRFMLIGAKPKGIKLINNKSFTQIVQQGDQMCFLYMDNSNNYFDVPTWDVNLSAEPDRDVPIEIEDLIVEFSIIFEDPKHLPPPRPGFDLRSPLKVGSNPLKLVKWKDLPNKYANWEFYYDILKRFPKFSPLRKRVYLKGRVLLQQLLYML